MICFSGPTHVGRRCASGPTRAHPPRCTGRTPANRTHGPSEWVGREAGRVTHGAARRGMCAARARGVRGAGAGRARDVRGLGAAWG
eukprot:scaffold78799_cov48-Phaeocystis_antarctica.AAC.2